MNSPEIEHLIGLLARLPGFGPRSARRAALRLLQQPQARMLPLAMALAEAARTVRTCSLCGNLDSADPCAICTTRRATRAWSAWWRGWATYGRWSGRRCIGGSTMCWAGRFRRWAGWGREDLNLRPLLDRVAGGRVAEVILALGATVEGAQHGALAGGPAGAVWRQGDTRGHGVPIGGALDVLDDGTMGAALKARRAV